MDFAPEVTYVTHTPECLKCCEYLKRGISGFLMSSRLSPAADIARLTYSRILHFPGFLGEPRSHIPSPLPTIGSLIAKVPLPLLIRRLQYQRFMCISLVNN